MSVRRPDKPRVQPVPEVLAKVRERTAAANVSATMAHHRGLARAFGNLYDTVLNQGVTPRRQRELVILRTGWNCQAEYEFGQHTLYGREAGVTDVEIHAVTRPLGTHPWDDEDRCLLQMADDLYTAGMVTDQTWDEMAARWSVEEIVEFISTSLCYVVVSGLLNTLGVELDEGVPGWPVL